MFCHLRVRSAFTFLYGTFLPERLVEEAASMGMKAAALTDRCGLYGAVRFVRAAQKRGVKPIIGAEVLEKGGGVLVLLVLDQRGYSNLVRLITLLKLKSPDGLPLEEVLQRSQGLVCLTGGRDGKLWRLLLQGMEDAALGYLGRLKEAFGDRLYVELHDHGLPEDRLVLERSLAVAKRLDVKPLVSNSVTFLRKEDWKVHRLLVQIQRKVHRRAVEPLPSDQFYFKRPEELLGLFPPEAVRNTVEVSERVSFELPLFKLHPPKLYEDANRRLTELCMRKLARRYRPLKAHILRRLWRELELITSRGFSGYFLVVHEVVSWARSRGIRCSIRGSASGSLVSCLLFGGPDPLEHGLLFERFLNEGRFDPPDIDVDFDSERREEVIRYVLDRFKGKAALVSTVHTFRARGALRDAARAMGRHPRELSAICDLVPYHLSPGELMRALEELPELRESPLRHEPELIEAAARLDGLPRQLSTHLGGVIVSEKLEELVPLELSPRGYPLSQFDKDDTEALGLPKFDLLGLRMHTAVAKTLSYLRERGIELDLDKLPLDDPEVYRLLRSGDTVGVFQVESPGQRQLLGRLQPRRFKDIIAEISLFRPGPVQADMITPFVNRKHKREPVRYIHKSLEPVLRETYGVIVFQEQVLRIVSELTGMGLDWADVFRRSMTSDRSREEMESLKEQFISLCLKRGHSRELAEEAWKAISAFAAYGFCKAHAASFAWITYQSAYLKAHYPLEFYLGLLNSGQVGTYPQRVILNEARRRFPVYPPHVNHSLFEYTREQDGIRVGFCAVRGIGPKLSERIVRERERNGPFRSLEDFIRRIRPSRRLLEVLMAVGAFHGLGGAGQEAA